MPSGSDKRQRNVQCHVRFTAEEFAQLVAKAEHAGWSPAAFLRASALGNPGPRTQHRRPADRDELRRLLGHYGRVGNNLNQIAQHLNINGTAESEALHKALAELQAIHDGVRSAIGIPTLDPDTHDHQGQQPGRT